MTLVGDSSHVGYLTSTDKRLFDRGYKINTDPKLPASFCYKDFEVSHGTFRNSISRLIRAKLVYVNTPGHPTFYACRGSGLKPQNVTLTRMVGSRHSPSMMDVLLSLGDAVAGVHDIRLLFDCPQLYDGLQLIPKRNSMDKQLLPISFGSGRVARVIAHRTGSISVIVGCSPNPFPRDNLTELSLILERVKDRLQFECLSAPLRVPPFSEWTVTQWHYNKDGGEISDAKYNITFRDLTGLLYRLYSKVFAPGIVRPRLERIESPRKTFAEIALSVLTKRD